MLIQFTGFNPTDPMDDSQAVELESSAITSVVSSITGDRRTYTTITNAIGAVFFVRETVARVNEMLLEAEHDPDAR